jgi:CheY-like chemotaxis protein
MDATYCGAMVARIHRYGTGNAKAIVKVSNCGLPLSSRILIVDDDPTIRYLVGRILADEGYQVVAAADGREGLKTLAASEISLVLLDLNMAGMNGQEMLKQLTVAHPELPVVIISARPRQSAENDMVGCSAFLQKPLDFLALLEVIKKLLNQAAARKQSETIVRKD